ncbi:MAG: ATP-binding protein [Bacillota bacterium]
MRELSLHILDIVQNSIEAGAHAVEITVREDEDDDLLTIEVADDGAGIPKDILGSVLDPFFTSRKTRKVGLGLPLFREAARATGGGLEVESEPGRGTRVRATFKLRHIDRAPLGDMAETIALLVVCNPQVRFKYSHSRGEAAFRFDSSEFERELGEVPITSPGVVLYLRDLIRGGLAPVQRA